MQGIPTSIIEDEIEIFDNDIQSMAIRILYPEEDRQLPFHPGALDAFTMMTQFSHYHGGLNLERACNKGPLLFAGTLATMSTYAPAGEFLPFLISDARDTLERIEENFNEKIEGSILQQYIPCTPEDLLYGHPDSLNITHTKKAMSTIRRLLNERHVTNFRLQVATHPEELDLTTPDQLRIINLIDRSQTGRLFNSDLSLKENDIPPGPFRSYLAHIYGLPQPDRGTRIICDSTTGETVNACLMRGHETDGMDRHAQHAATCDSGNKSATILHNMVQSQVCNTAIAMGIPTTRETHTATILQGEFSRDQCQRMFPKRRTKKKSKSAAQYQDNMKATLNELSAPSTTPARRNELMMNLQNMQQDIPYDGEGLRVDGTLIFGKTNYLFDVSLLAPLCKTSVGHNKNFFIDEAVAETNTQRNGVSNPYEQQTSPAVARRSASKHTKYYPLIQMARAQKLMGISNTDPEFLALTLSHLGEMSRDFLQLVNLIAEFERKRPLNRKRRDGVTPSVAKAKCKKDFMDNIISVLAKGVGIHLKATGYSCSKRD